MNPVTDYFIIPASKLRTIKQEFYLLSYANGDMIVKKFNRFFTIRDFVSLKTKFHEKVIKRRD